MKTLEEVDREIIAIVKFGESGNDKDKRKANRDLKFLREMYRYLEFSPTEESVTQQLELVQKQYDRVNKLFDVTFPRGCDTQSRADFMKNEGMSTLNKKMKHLNYILS